MRCGMADIVQIAALLGGIGGASVLFLAVIFWRNSQLFDDWLFRALAIEHALLGCAFLLAVLWPAEHVWRLLPRVAALAGSVAVLITITSVRRNGRRKKGGEP